MRPSADRIAHGLYWDRAWSLVEGCMPVSAGCDNCWAARAAHMRNNHPNGAVRRANEGLTSFQGFVDTPDEIFFKNVVRTREDLLDLPSRTKKPTVFAVWTDLFHEEVRDVFIQSAFIAMKQSPQHTFLILTKRASRMSAFMNKYQKEEILPHVWLGVTAENQQAADERIPLLLQTPAAKRFVSVEPMLSPVVFNGPAGAGKIDWVICGGESGPAARPMQVEWARSLRDQCKSAGVPFWFKQMSKKEPIPADLMIREFPSW